jgi:molecular chaperone DnaJ
MNDYYDILGVTKDSTTEEIKKAYRRLSKEHHPDRGGDGERFKKIAEAYTTLGDENKRNSYNSRQNSPFGGGFSHDAMGDMFKDMFNQGTGGRNTGEDLVVNIEVPLEDIHTGSVKKIRYRRKILDRNTPSRTCHTCNGVGSVTLMGPFKTRCNTCNGVGRIHSTTLIDQELSFNILKGVKDGERIFYAGLGNETPTGPGNLFVTIKVLKHESFIREGDNLIMSLYISFPDIILGKEIEIKTLTGKIKLNIKENSRPFDRMRVAGKGLNRTEGMGVGDLIIELVPVTPIKINNKERKLLEELKVSENFNNIKH